MNKHTPGPWYAKEEGCHVGEWWEVKTAGGRSVALMRSIGPHVESQEAANARLIAAAPELLAACERILKAWHDFPDLTDDSTNDFMNTIEIAVMPLVRAAIDKATEDS